MELTSRRRVAARHLTSNPWHKPDWQAGYRILWCGILYSIPACQPAHSASRIDIDLPHQFRPGMMSLVNSRDASMLYCIKLQWVGSLAAYMDTYRRTGYLGTCSVAHWGHHLGSQSVHVEVHTSPPLGFCAGARAYRLQMEITVVPAPSQSVDVVCSDAIHTQRQRTGKVGKVAMSSCRMPGCLATPCFGQCLLSNGLLPEPHDMWWWSSRGLELSRPSRLLLVSPGIQAS